jgi:Carboxypeptidase regulatory-like domain
VKVFTSGMPYLFVTPIGLSQLEVWTGGTLAALTVDSLMRHAVLGVILLFALGDSCSAPPNVVGVQDYGRVAGRVLDATTNRPIPNALLSVGSLFAIHADVNGGFTLRAVAGDQTVTARAAGYSSTTVDTTIPKDATVSIGYIRLVPLTYPAGQPTLAPPPTPRVSAAPSAATTSASPAPSPSASPVLATPSAPSATTQPVPSVSPPTSKAT